MSSPQSALTPSFARRVWRLARPYFVSEQRGRAVLLLVAVVGLNLMAVYVDVLLNDFNREFYNALEQRDYVKFKEQLFRFTYLAFFWIVVVVYRFYLTQLFEMRWREWMTQAYIQKWLAARAYYRIELAGHET
jgi:vitamin B12/bleomycin/antimicrobial peptide transport system ATP-binding/permease protein